MMYVNVELPESTIYPAYVGYSRLMVAPAVINGVTIDSVVFALTVVQTISVTPGTANIACSIADILTTPLNGNEAK